MNTPTQKITCPKCSGAGRLIWTRRSNGLCYECNGAKVITVPTISTTAAKRIERMLETAMEGAIDEGRVYGAGRIAAAFVALDCSATARRIIREAAACDWSGCHGNGANEAMGRVIAAVLSEGREMKAAA